MAKCSYPGCKETKNLSRCKYCEDVYCKRHDQPFAIAEKDIPKTRKLPAHKVKKHKIHACTPYLEQKQDYGKSEMNYKKIFDGSCFFVVSLLFDMTLVSAMVSCLHEETSTGHRTSGYPRRSAGWRGDYRGS